MRRDVKIRRLQQLDGLRDERVVENDRTQNSSFSFGTAGKRPFENGVANRFRGCHLMKKLERHRDEANSFRSFCVRCGIYYTGTVTR